MKSDENHRNLTFFQNLSIGVSKCWKSNIYWIYNLNNNTSTRKKNGGDERNNIKLVERQMVILKR